MAICHFAQVTVVRCFGTLLCSLFMLGFNLFFTVAEEVLATAITLDDGDTAAGN